MGVYDSYGRENIQIKAGDPEGVCFNVGDRVPLEDGIYLAYEGVVVIKDGKMLCEFEGKDYPIFDKWGNEIPISIRENNPIGKAITEFFGNEQ